MTHGHRLLTPILLFDLSLTSSRRLSRLFSYSEAPFWTARNQSRFRLFHSDSPLCFMSFGSLRLKARKHTVEDRYCVCILDAYEAAIPPAGSHSRKIARSKLEHVSICSTVGPPFGRNSQRSGSHAGTRSLLLEASSSAYVSFGFYISVAELLATIRSSIWFNSQYMEPYCLVHRV
jgi:hypothetical protein